MATKKSNFFYCDGCMGIFAAGTGITAPKNKHKLKLVCTKCFKKYIGSHVPLPSGASALLKNLFGGFLTVPNIYAGGGIISDKSGGVVSNGGSGLISNKAAGLLGNSSNTLVGHDGSSLIGQDGSSFRRK
jgi:hypothetical protein